MKRNLFLLSFLAALAVAQPARAAQQDVGEGYARPTFKEMIQTIVMLGGIDITDTKMADQYIRLVYCDAYKKNFKDDLAWDKLRKQVTARVQEKKEYYRLYFETVGTFTLGRYDTDKGVFPITTDTALNNIGSMTVLTDRDYTPYCDSANDKTPFFSPFVNLVLERPLTLNRIPYAADKVAPLLARMAEAKNDETKQVYGRIRFRVTDAPKPAVITTGSKHTPIREELRGEVLAIDFFIDPEMTKPLASVPVK